MRSEKVISLEGKVALVTGAARGLGLACAQSLAAAGAQVMVTDILETEGAEAASAITKAGGIAKFLYLDVTSEGDWEKAVATTVEQLGGLHILVNNAGIELASFLTDMSFEAWRRVQAVNYDSVFLGLREAVRAMKPDGISGQGGSIINISSAAGMRGFAGQAAYCGSKGGVRLLTKSAAVECAKLGMGIRVNSVHPAVIKTPMYDEILPEWAEMFTGGDKEALHEAVVGWHPMGYLGEPDDVANAVLFLASDFSKFTTGSELLVDGGLCAAG
jgi:3alpha(or 20beta)-hydroxysteroid dehydrogenase